jgi:hypothetical protein
MMGCWGNVSDTDRINHGGSMDRVDTAKMLQTRAHAIVNTKTWKHLSKDDALKLKIPRCPQIEQNSAKLLNTSASLLGDDAASVHTYLDRMLAGLDRTTPLIVAVIEKFNFFDRDHEYEKPSGLSKRTPQEEDTERKRTWEAQTSKLSLNFLCGMRRLQLESRFLIFALDEETHQSLGAMGTTAKVLSHPGLNLAAEKAANNTNTFSSGKNRVAKLFLPLLLLERGFSLILTDIDTYWVRDPTPHLLSLNVDLAAGLDGCVNTLNSGFIYYSSGEGPKKILRAALNMRKWQEGDLKVSADNDQYLFNCAHARVFSAGGVHSWTLPRPSFQFGRARAGFVNLYCGESRGDDRPKELSKELPFVFHASGASGPAVLETTNMLQTVGFWDIDETGVRGPSVCVAGVRGDTDRAHIDALKAGQDSCQKAWHKRCDCKAEDWQRG